MLQDKQSLWLLHQFLQTVRCSGTSDHHAKRQLVTASLASCISCNSLYIAHGAPSACLSLLLASPIHVLLSVAKEWMLCSAGGSPNGRATAGRHITRIQRPIPTRQHPLSGLWKGDLGRDGIHVFSISCDFSGPAARISAIQVGLPPFNLAALRHGKAT